MQTLYAQTLMAFKIQQNTITWVNTNKQQSGDSGTPTDNLCPRNIDDTRWRAPRPKLDVCHGEWFLAEQKCHPCTVFLGIKYTYFELKHNFNFSDFHFDLYDPTYISNSGYANVTRVITGTKSGQDVMTNFRHTELYHKTVFLGPQRTENIHSSLKAAVPVSQVPPASP